MVESILTFALGIFAWTFIEYAIHAWMSHTFDTFASPLHEVHHRDPRAVFTIGAWIPIAALYLFGIAIAGFSSAMVFFSGAVAGFVAYEAIHYRIHFRPSRNAFERHLRTRHLLHHKHNSNASFGVTSELWDLVFGTEPLGVETRRIRERLASTPPVAGPSNLRKIIYYSPLRMFSH